MKKIPSTKESVTKAKDLLNQQETLLALFEKLNNNESENKEYLVSIHTLPTFHVNLNYSFLIEAINQKLLMITNELNDLAE